MIKIRTFEEDLKECKNPEEVKFLWPDGSNFKSMMKVFPLWVYIDDNGERNWFKQSVEDKKVYLFMYDEDLNLRLN